MEEAKQVKLKKQYIESLIQKANELELKKANAIEAEEYDQAAMIKQELDKVSRNLMSGNVPDGF